MSNDIIQLHEVWFSYNGEPVLESVNLDISAGDFLAIIGPNGGGKTTLLKLMLGLLIPTRGEITIFGHPPADITRRVGYVRQHTAVDPIFPISVAEVVAMGALTPGAKWPGIGKQQRKTAMTALALMGIEHLAHRRMGNLSGGQRQRAFIARALVDDPEILFLDEPTAGIDAQGQMDLYCILEDLNRHMTIVMVSHDMLALSTHVKSVACVNRHVHYHDHPELTHDMMETMYPHTQGEACPVELVAHGVPHRVLRSHDDHKQRKKK